MAQTQPAPSDLRKFYEVDYERSFAPAVIPAEDDFMYGQTLRHLRPYLRPGVKVLDLGCNNGSLSLFMAKQGCEVLGVDLARNIVQTAERSAAQYGIAGARFRAMDFQLEWDRPEEFDFVLCSHVIEHVPDDVGFLRKIRTALKPGGRLMLLTPTAYSSLVFVSKLFTGKFEHDEKVGHLRRYTASMMRRRMADAGLRVRKLDWVDSALREWIILTRPLRPLQRIVGRRYVRSAFNRLDDVLAACRIFPSAVCVHAERETA